MLGDTWLRYLLYYSSRVDQIAGVPGTVVECRVSSGNSFAMLAALTRGEGAGRPGKPQQGMFAASRRKAGRFALHKSRYNDRWYVVKLAA